MKRYSVFAIAREAFRDHTGWERAWRNPTPKAQYDAIIVGAPTRFGRMPSQMAAFLDQAGGLWARGALNGKVGGAFTSTATQHGGQEVTLFSIITNLMHFGMVIVGLPYSHQGQMTLDEIVGGSPYGATTIAGGKGERQPQAHLPRLDLRGCRVCLPRHADHGYRSNRGDEVAKRACENKDHRVRLMIATGVKTYSTRR